MANINGFNINTDSIEFVSTIDNTIDGDLTIEKDLIVDGEIKLPVKIVTFADGTDDEIAAMLEAHYNGDIDISKYWSVGDMRIVHIDATNSGTTDHIAQDMTMVIMGFNHDDLSTPINGVSKAAVSVGFREMMGNNGTSEDEYYWGSSYYPVQDDDIYPNNPLRIWLNNGLLNALPRTFSSLIKEVNKKNLPLHKDSAISSGVVVTSIDKSIKPMSWEVPAVISKDKIWLLSYPEIYGDVKYNYYHGEGNYEGDQYEYMKIESNRIKYPNKNGEKGSGHYYWLRSPSSDYSSSDGYFWCFVDSDGSAYIDRGYGTNGLAPAFCL